MVKKLIILLLMITVSIIPNIVVYANSDYIDGDTNDIYTITREDGTFLFEKAGVEIGDLYINSDFEEYEVISIDYNFMTGVARFNAKLTPPKVDINFSPTPINTVDKKICMYSTHNDESYITGDGVDSVYGKGGIHDVANKLKNELNKKGITTIYNETLHIPHDTSAYNRSKITANTLMDNYNPNAIFDIHRDGASRSTYVSKYNGKDVCKIRMVIGKSNKNYKVNQEFALYLMSVSKEICPWLFLDIYFGNGHYNQSISNKAILFEMGSHLVEKDLVLKSVEPLANVINTALFGTTINEEGDAIIGGNIALNPTIDEYFDNENLAKNIQKDGNSIWIIVVLLIATLTVVVVSSIAMYLIKKEKRNSDSFKR